jgi:hypothetical protein
MVITRTLPLIAMLLPMLRVSFLHALDPLLVLSTARMSAIVTVGVAFHAIGSLQLQYGIFPPLTGATHQQVVIAGGPTLLSC